jgi:hypothetical protein
LTDGPDDLLGDVPSELLDAADVGLLGAELPPAALLALTLPTAEPSVLVDDATARITMATTAMTDTATIAMRTPSRFELRLTFP